MEDAKVSYESGQAVVSFDSTATTPDEFIAELERMTGFTATVEETGQMTPAGPAREH